MNRIGFPLNVDRGTDRGGGPAGRPPTGPSSLDYDEFVVSSDWTWGDDTRYGFAAGYIRAVDRRLISSERFLRLAEAGSVEEVLAMLGDSDYAKEHQDQLYVTGDSEAPGIDIESLIRHEALRVRDMINDLTPDRETTDILFVRDDFFNLKLALKGIVGNIRVGDFFAPLGLIGPDVIYREAGEPEKSDTLPPFLREAAVQAMKAYNDTKNPMDIDRVVDALMFEHLLEGAMDKRIFFLYKLFRIEIDLVNIITFFRLKWQGEPPSVLPSSLTEGGILPFRTFFEFYPREVDDIETGFCANERYRDLIGEGIVHLKNERSFTHMEGLVDRELMKFIDREKEINFGAEILIAYFYRKAVEMRRLRTVVIGKRNGVSPQEIKARLGYVG